MEIPPSRVRRKFVSRNTRRGLLAGTATAPVSRLQSLACAADPHGSTSSRRQFRPLVADLALDEQQALVVEPQHVALHSHDRCLAAELPLGQPAGELDRSRRDLLEAEGQQELADHSLLAARSLAPTASLSPRCGF